MKFDTFLADITKVKSKTLGGINSQMKMAPAIRQQLIDLNAIDLNAKTAAVLCLIYPNKDNETCIALTKRASYKGTHSNQISFPGGKQEEKDTSLWYTAIRETTEEIGIDSNKIELIREMTKTYIPPSNFWVHPFIGILNENPTFKTNYEVENIIELKLSSLLDDSTMTVKRIDASYMKQIDCPCFIFKKDLVWGATAMILNEVKELLKAD